MLLLQAQTVSWPFLIEHSPFVFNRGWHCLSWKCLVMAVVESVQETVGEAPSFDVITLFGQTLAINEGALWML